jgi:hypothetical protein
LSPVKKSRQFHSLDAAADPELHKEPVEVRLHRAAIHPYNGCDFSVAAAL